MLIGFNDGKDAVNIEVDDDKCFAYFWSGERDGITGGVWLFNIGETPTIPPWEQGESLPCKNPSEYCHPHHISLPIVESDFGIHFTGKENVGIYFRKYLVGMLANNWRTGKALYAKEDSPLAGIMDVKTDRPARL